MLKYNVHTPLSSRTPERNGLHRYTPSARRLMLSIKMLIAFSPEISKIFGLLI